MERSVGEGSIAEVNQSHGGEQCATLEETPYLLSIQQPWPRRKPTAGQTRHGPWPVSGLGRRSLRVGERVGSMKDHRIPTPTQSTSRLASVRGPSVESPRSFR